MGKRSQQKMTGLSTDQRIKRSIQRKEKEEEQKAKEALELTKALIGILPLEPEPKHKHEPEHKHEDMWEIPLPPSALSPVMRQLTQLEQERRKRKR